MLLMRAIFVLSLGAMVPAFVWQDGRWIDLAFLAAIVATASGIVILRNASTPGKGPAARPGRRSKGWRRKARRPIIVDGSNVMHWKNQSPQLDTVREVISALDARGFQTGVVFDANAGYRLTGRYLDGDPLARMLGLPADHVLVVPKGSPADPVILQYARSLGARIVTNDRYRDWAEDFPEVATPGHLVRGGYRETGLFLALEDEAGAEAVQAG